MAPKHGPIDILPIRHDVEVCHCLGEILDLHGNWYPPMVFRNQNVGHQARDQFGAVTDGDGMDTPDMVVHGLGVSQDDLAATGLQLDELRIDGGEIRGDLPDRLAVPGITEFPVEIVKRAHAAPRSVVG